MEMVANLPVAEAREGDPAAWETLFKRFQLPLFVYLMQMVGPKETCFDLVQETFLAASRHLGSLRQDDRFASWLFSIAHQKAMQTLRTQGRRPEEVLIEPDTVDERADERADPSALLIAREDEAAFWNGLTKLSEPQKTVVLLHFLEDFSVDEMARILNIPPGTVKSRLFHARKILRRHLKHSL